jgi:hypothetical protein
MNGSGNFIPSSLGGLRSRQFILLDPKRMHAGIVLLLMRESAGRHDKNRYISSGCEWP